jgi:FixJ family two-component response regulator
MKGSEALVSCARDPLGQDLEITERTIKLHRTSILQKLEVNSMAEMARLAADLGINPPKPVSCTNDQ